MLTLLFSAHFCNCGPKLLHPFFVSSFSRPVTVSYFSFKQRRQSSPGGDRPMAVEQRRLWFGYSCVPPRRNCSRYLMSPSLLLPALPPQRLDQIHGVSTGN
jgi:hypothetical protein